MTAMALALVLLVGLAVDASGQVYTKQRAQAIAAEAARAGGQQLHGADAIRGQDPVLDPGAAITAANTYLAAVQDVTGAATVTSSTTITVTTTSTYTTVFLNLIGIHDLTVTGRAEIAINRTLQGETR